MDKQVPARARIVVIGGGIIGTSVAYHLTKLGETDVVVLEQGELSSGTTWHAAGLVGQLRANESGTRLVQYSTELYSELEAEVGLSTGFKRCGGVTVARTEDRMTFLRRTAATAAAFDLECELLSPEQALERFPVMQVDDLVGAIWLPGDGKANPTDLTAALARGARQNGAQVFEHTRVIDVLVQDQRVTGVRTDAGDIEAEIVVNCAGQWAKAVGDLAGVNVPLHSAEHFYVVTDPIEGVHPDLPVLRDPDGYTYFKEEVGGLVVGGFEPDAKPWVAPDQIPYPFEFELLEEDWDHFAPLMESAVLRIPVLGETGIRKFYNGPESFTPDNQFILGEAPEVQSFFVAAGLNSVGIAAAGGAGRALAEWIVEGEPTMDLTSVDIRRFARFNGNNQWLHDRVAEVLGLHYEIPWPNREMRTARPFRRSPLYADLVRANANFGSKMGWERANFFAPEGETPDIEYSWGKQNWLPWTAAEHANTRENVTVFDQTSFSKYRRDRSRRRVGAAVDVHRGRRSAGRAHRLHRHAQRPRHLRVGPDPHPGGVRRVPHRQQRCDHRARPGPHPATHRGPPRHAGRRDLVVRRPRGDGPEGQRPAHPADPLRPRATMPSRSAPVARSRSATRPSAPPGSPTWASWAGSSTCRPSSPWASTRT